MRCAAATALALALLAGDARAQTQPLESIPTLALDVANPRRTGRRIVHFEDLIGPRARPLAQPTKALLVVLMAPGRAQSKGTTLEGLAEAAASLAASGGMLIGVVLPGATGADDPAVDAEQQPFLVAEDPYGLARKRLGLVGPGHAIVIRSDGRVAGTFAPEAFASAVRTAAALLKEEQ